jgi:ABC-type multidrug transport system ATPase subunit/pSer/pThr/pTyr-binding forkhead associated (FHA) protein
MNSYSIKIFNNGIASVYNSDGKSEMVLGRSKDPGIITVEHDHLSRRHIKILFTQNGIKAVDLGSKNGSFLNGFQLKPDQAYDLPLEEKLYLIGDKSIYLEVSKAPQNIVVPSNTSSAQGLKDYLQKKQEITIGRNSNCDIVLNDNSVSREHAKVFNKNGQILVQDLNSTNGVYVNGKRISGTTQLNETDTLFIGLHAFKLGEKAKDLSKESAIVTSEITKVFSNGYVGLQPTSIQIPYKQMIALMGPSGCGKSTLLKALNGDSLPSQGSVKIFGLDMAENFEMIKHIIGYVPQENIVHEDLTVQQSLYFAAKLRLPDDINEDQIQNRITEVLESLKINNDVIRETKVCKLSGGQKKRVSIAVELLNKPKILFLDEPTSPLDPETIEEFLLCLKSLCNEGTTVIMVTHKPDDLNYVDRVIFMGVNGHLAYEGPVNELIPHFGKDRLIQLYSLLSNKTEAQSWYHKWHKSQPGKVPSPKNIQVKKLPVNYLSQTIWLSRRYFSIKLGNRMNLGIMLMQPVLIAILVILAFEGLFKTSTLPTGESLSTPNVGILFLMAIAAVWFGVSNSAKEIVGEKDVLKREYMYNMKLSTYLCSKVFVLTVISAVQILILQSLLFLKFSELSQFPLTWLYLMLISVCSIQFGLLLSSFASSTEEVMSVLPIALMPQIILAGMIQPLESKITVFLSYFTLGRWGTEGIARVQDISRTDKPFMNVLDKHLYSETVGQVINTDALQSNIAAIFILFTLMTIAIFVILNTKLNPSN